MTKNIFDSIFDNEILPFIDEIQQNNSLVIKKDIETCKEAIYKEYLALRGCLKETVFGDRETDKLMDRHKIASCICGAFLKVSVFNKTLMIQRIQKQKERIEAYFYYVNELVAFVAGCKFLSFFMTSECIGRGDENRAEQIIRIFPVLPPVNQSTLGCYDSILFNLSQIKTNEIGLEHFDIYSYSMFFFMLESYYNTRFEVNKT